jgi:hemerythrin
MEERLMAAEGYPSAEAHLAQHREFQRRFQLVENHVAARGPMPSAILELKDLIRGWLVAHIGTTDQALAAFLHGRAPPPGGR